MGEAENSAPVRDRYKNDESKTDRNSKVGWWLQSYTEMRTRNSRCILL